MKPEKIFAMLLASLLLLFAATSALAVTLTVGDKTTYLGDTSANVPITVDVPGEIAGAAFTVIYDAGNLTLSNVSSTFFDTFANQGISPTTVTVDSVVYDQPLLMGAEDPALGTVGGTMLAAARVQAGASGTTLFTLNFDITGAALGDYQITIIPSTISNTDAGYAPEGEEIPMLVGAIDEEQDLTLAFPEITADSVIPGVLSVTNAEPPCSPGDVFPDGSVDITDVLQTIDIIFGSLEPNAQEFCAADLNGDGSIDITDILLMIDIIFGL